MFPDKCCFQVIYFNPNISFPPSIEVRLGPVVETTRLIPAVKNTRARPASPPSGLARDLRAPRGAVGQMERLMSMRIGVALAAAIGVGVLMSSAAEARPEMV